VSLVLITPPIDEPISLAETKRWIKQDASDADDMLIEGLMRSARLMVDGPKAPYNIALLNQTWDYIFDAFPTGYEWPADTWMKANSIEVPLYPLISVTYVKYIDETGTLQTLSAAKYRVVTWEELGRIEPAYGEYWPVTRRISGAVTVRFVAGHGSADDVPDRIKHWLMATVGASYENRETLAPGAVVEVPGLANMMDEYRRRRTCMA
jgi:uncharacterized phiE125 gp8 family phage protein